MAVDDAQGLQIAFHNLRAPPSAILVTDAMKAIAANILLEPSVGPRIDLRFWQQMAMISSIEDSHLRKLFTEDARGRMNTFDVVGIVQRRELDARFDAVCNFCSPCILARQSLRSAPQVDGQAVEHEQEQ